MSDTPNLPDILETLEPATLPRLRELIDELLRVNQQFNLTAVRDADEAWIKHIVDSLQGLHSGLFVGRKSFVDVGTGAGFPGLPLALAQSDLRPTFLEATRKKCDFIKAT
ncbi:MAG: rRNA (guanine527-N7)-methyltransferase, partial [Abditibacteriota bacterium]|nr:rRNA (guanine527-N7)-methyltransferase [Abditibacteriota bacterium]